MPTRSLSSSVMKWPDANDIDMAIRRWAQEIIKLRPEILQIGYFGSYARKDWGVGRDCDIIIIVKNTRESFERRPRFYNPESLPVPTDVLVYTQEEREKVRQNNFGKKICSETAWVYIRH